MKQQQQEEEEEEEEEEVQEVQEVQRHTSPAAGERWRKSQQAWG